MPKPIALKLVLRILADHGFLFVSQNGSHAKYRHETTNRTLIVKNTKKEIPHGTFRSILNQSGLSESDFRL